MNNLSSQKEQPSARKLAKDDLRIEKPDDDENGDSPDNEKKKKIMFLKSPMVQTEMTFMN